MSNITQLNPTRRDCMQFLIDRRFACRLVIGMLDAVHLENARARRLARKSRETKNPILIRRAETIETEAAARREAMQQWRDALLAIGRELMELSDGINTALPQGVLLDLLNVNQAERRTIEPGDGIAEIAYIKGLEDSAMFRGNDWKQGPFAQAVNMFMSHELMHNKELQQTAHEHLFGKGGMFEFLPMYKTGGGGEMVRMPPKLRIADKCDVKSEAA